MKRIAGFTILAMCFVSVFGGLVYGMAHTVPLFTAFLTVFAIAVGVCAFAALLWLGIELAMSDTPPKDFK